MASALLEIENMEVAFTLENKAYPALQQISFKIGEKETVGIVGESGCGKSLTSLSVMGLLPETAAITKGGMTLDGKPLAFGSAQEWSGVRGKLVSMIFQNPMSALNPLMPVGKQIAEMARTHLGVSKREGKRLALDMMGRVGLSRVDRLYDDYPHRLSGGMMQRIMIAMALVCGPKLLIADEPTTALDVTIQAQILQLLIRLKDELGMALLLITHDLGVVAEAADRVLLMRDGRLLEDRGVRDFFDGPRHPYGRALLAARPGRRTRGEPRPRLADTSVSDRAVPFVISGEGGGAC